MNTLAKLEDMNLCKDAVVWATRLGPDITAEQLWAQCQRGDWMLEIALATGVAPASVVTAAAACAREALPLFEACYPRDTRVRRCLDTIEAWTRNEATIEQVGAAHVDASAAVDDTGVSAAYRVGVSYVVAHAAAIAAQRIARATITYAAAPRAYADRTIADDSVVTAVAYVADVTAYVDAAINPVDPAVPYAAETAFAAARDRSMARSADLVRHLGPAVIAALG